MNLRLNDNWNYIEINENCLNEYKGDSKKKLN